MSATLTPNGIPEHMSPFTLAIMEDSGWYKANWTIARNPSFGHGAGCDFVNKPCIVDDTVPSYGESYFCDTTDKIVVKCDPTHRMMATCNLYDLSKKTGQEFPPVPQVYRYFSNPVSQLPCLIHAF
jgi:leishmanolysin-like peptidase